MSPWLFYYGIGIADPGPPARNLFAFGSERYAHRGGLLVPAILYRNPPILNPTETPTFRGFASVTGSSGEKAVPRRECHSLIRGPVLRPRVCFMICIEQSLLRDMGVDLGCR